MKPTSPTQALHKPSLVTAERVVRNALLYAIAAVGVFVAGQYSGVSTIASAAQAERESVWAASSPDRAAALDKYRACTEDTKARCVERATSGDLQASLTDLVSAEGVRSEAIPAPLRWFFQ